MPTTWTLKLDDDAVRVDTAVGAAGNTTSVGNNWTDLNGSTGKITTNSFDLVPTAANGNTWKTDYVLRPSGEVSNVQRIKLYIAAGAFNSTCAYGGILRYSSGNFYLLGVGVSSPLTLNIYRITGNTTPASIINKTLNSINTAHAFSFDYSIDSSNLLSIVVTDETTSTVVDTLTGTENTYTAAGRTGLTSWNSTSTTTHVIIDRVQVYDGATSLVPGVVSLSARSAANLSATLSSTAPSGGSTTGFTYQWQVSSASGTGYANATGGTSSTLTYSAITPGRYYFVCNYTDSASNTSTSNEISVVISGQQIFVGSIGDSITYGQGASQGTQLTTPAPTTMGTTLESLYGYRLVMTNNQGVGGSQSAGWLTGGSGFNTALSAFNTASSGIQNKYVSIMLGTNDAYTVASITKASFKANIINICTGWLANGYIPILHQVIYTNSNLYSLILIRQYNDAINEVISANANILRGDIAGYQYFSDHYGTEMNSDTVHPNQFGATALGNLWAQAIWRALYDLKFRLKRSLKL